jgi:hypothetical protein
MKSLDCLLARLSAVTPITSPAQEFRRFADIHKRLLGATWILLAVVGLGITLPAQDTQRFEAFGGYSFSYNNYPVVNRANFNGWNGSSTVFVNRWLGITADFSGAYGSQASLLFCDSDGCLHERNSLSSYTYLVGPHFVYRRSRYAPFAEPLFGIHNPHTSSSWNITQCQPIDCGSGNGPLFRDHKFAMAVGGGLDIALAHGISIRPVEVDYVLLKEVAYRPENGTFVSYNANNNTFRYSGGITFRFGSHLGPPR